MKILKALLLLAGTLMLSASCSLSRIGEKPTDLKYDFVVTTNRAEQDILLVEPENKGIYIGVLGRIFYRTEQTKKNKAKWPEGKWWSSAGPPLDPPRAWWEYQLTLNADGSLEFIEIEHRQEYDEEWRPKGPQSIRTRLHMLGRWRLGEGNRGVLIFTETKVKPEEPDGGTD